MESNKPNPRRKSSGKAPKKASTAAVMNRIVSLTPDEYEALRKHCYETGESMTYVMRTALRKHLGMEATAAPKRGPQPKSTQQKK